VRGDFGEDSGAIALGVETISFFIINHRTPSDPDLQEMLSRYPELTQQVRSPSFVLTRLILAGICSMATS